jgi:hypothetical protein
MSEPEQITQHAPPAAAEYLRASGPLRISLTIMDASGEPVFHHDCQQQGLLHELKMRLWRRVRVATEPLACAFMINDNPGSTWVYGCKEPLEDGRIYFLVTVPGGAVKVPCCPKHRAVLEQRERAFDE